MQTLSIARSRIHTTITPRAVPIQSIHYEKHNVPRGACYCRVDDPSQERYLWECVESMRQQYPDHEVIGDIGSAWDYRRSGLVKLMQSVGRNEIREVVVDSMEDLSSTATNHILRYLEYHKVHVVEIRHKKDV